MNNEERTDHLYEQAKAQGLEHPNDRMISGAIHDAEQEVEQDILQALQAGGLSHCHDRHRANVQELST